MNKYCKLSLNPYMTKFDLFQPGRETFGFEHSYAKGYVKCGLHGSDL